MSDYNLTDNVDDSFQFEVAGIKYQMRYPILEETEKINNIKGDEESKGEQLTAWFYALITPVLEDSPSIEDVMKKQNVRVMRNFRKMLKEEMGIEE